MNPAERRPSVLLYFLRPYGPLLSGILLVSLLASLFESLNVAAFFPVFNSLLNAEGGQRPIGGILARLVALTSRLPFRDPVIGAGVLLVGVTLAKAFLVFWRESLVAHASGRVQHDVKLRLMEIYAQSGYPFFLTAKQGQLIYNLTTATTRVGVMLQKVPQLLAELLKVIAIGALLFLTVPAATVVVAGIGLAYHGLTHFLSRKISYHTGQGRVVSAAAQTSIAGEFFTGIRQMMAFETQKHWLQRFAEQSELFRRLFVRDSVWLAAPKILLEGATVLFLFGFLLFFRLMHPDQLSGYLPLFAIFGVGLLKLLPSLTVMGQLRMELVGLTADAELVYAALTRPLGEPTTGGHSFEGIRKGIHLARVGFSYPGREPLFRNLALTLAKGKTTAIVGSSGSGKSTLAYLLLGLLQPDEGKILVDGVDLRDLDLGGWRRRIGFVSQELFIFHASVKENILFGRGGFSDESVRRAAEIANAHLFIDHLPQKYDTMVGERGMKLSGGQQQRIAIARSILHDPEILIFDEATSFLDTESEHWVQEAIAKISRDRTVVLIAHRLSTVREADRIIVLEGGAVVEEGTHPELLQGRGRYFELVASALHPEEIRWLGESP